MATELTKFFSFSACHTSSGKVLGRNYRFGITVEWVNQAQEERLIETVRRELISKVHTRDLGENVDFLKNISIDDASLLKEFKKRLSAALMGFNIKRLTLERDSETSTVLFLENS